VKQVNDGIAGAGLVPQVTRRAGLALLLAATLAAPAIAAPKSREEKYGTHGRQRLDVYARPGLSSAPVLLFVHGGAWTRGDKRGVNELPEYAERNGFLLMSTDYRLAPDVDAGGSAEDVAGAFAWAKANAAKYGGDPNRIFLVGHSAGAHLVVLVAVDPTYLARANLAPKDIAGVIALDGAGYDAAQEMKWFDKRGGPVAKMFHEAFGKRPGELSPTLVVRSGIDYPPFMILYITSRLDSPPQSRALAAAIRRSGGKVVVRPTSDATHAEINKSFGVAGDAEGEMGAAFMKTGLLPGALAEPMN
jgi:arylformamidase